MRQAIVFIRTCLIVPLDFTVLLDTGSTDLWVNSKGLELLFANTTDLTIAEDYERGQVQGTLQFAELKVGDYVVPSQGECRLPIRSERSSTVFVSFHQCYQGRYRTRVAQAED